MCCVHCLPPPPPLPLLLSLPPPPQHLTKILPPFCSMANSRPHTWESGATYSSSTTTTTTNTSTSSQPLSPIDGFDAPSIFYNSGFERVLFWCANTSLFFPVSSLVMVFSCYCNGESSLVVVSNLSLPCWWSFVITAHKVPSAW